MATVGNAPTNMLHIISGGHSSLSIEYPYIPNADLQRLKNLTQTLLCLVTILGFVRVM